MESRYGEGLDITKIHNELIENINDFNKKVVIENNGKSIWVKDKNRFSNEGVRINNEVAIKTTTDFLTPFAGLKDSILKEVSKYQDDILELEKRINDTNKRIEQLKIEIRNNKSPNTQLINQLKLIRDENEAQMYQNEWKGWMSYVTALQGLHSSSKDLAYSLLEYGFSPSSKSSDKSINDLSLLTTTIKLMNETLKNSTTENRDALEKNMKEVAIRANDLNHPNNEKWREFCTYAAFVCAIIFVSAILVAMTVASAGIAPVVAAVAVAAVAAAAVGLSLGTRAVLSNEIEKDKAVGSKAKNLITLFSQFFHLHEKKSPTPYDKDGPPADKNKPK